MTQIFHLPEDIRQEFTIDYDGSAYASQSAIARLCGVTRQSINELFEKILSGKSLSESLNPFSSIDYTVSGKIPDIVVAAIINHYAMYARNTTDQAKKVSREGRKLLPSAFVAQRLLPSRDAGLKTLQKALVFDEDDKDSFENTYYYIIERLLKANWENHDLADKIKLEVFRRNLDKGKNE